jgi:PAS domain S-box-containing protein
VYVAGFFYIIIQNPYSVVNWVLSMLFFYIAFWSICNAILYNTGISHETASIVVKAQGIGWASFITYYFLFVLFLTGSRKLLENPLVYIVIISIPGVFIYQNFAGNMLECCRVVSYGVTADWKDTPWTYAYYIYYTIMFCAGTYLLFAFRNRTGIKTEKRIADILLLSAICVFAFGTMSSVIMKRMGIFLPLDANVTFLIFVAGLIYCARKYEMLSLTGPRIADKIMNSINEGLLLISRDGEILSANTAAMEIFGYAGENPSLFRWDKIENSVQAVQAMLKSGVEDFEMQVTTPGGESRVLFVSARALEGMAGKSESVCIIRDITKKKTAETELAATVEDLKRSNDELESFAYVASHDLKEPLRMIASYIQLLKKRSAEKFNPDEMDYINFVSEGAMRMDGLISDLLDYSRVNRKGVEFTRTDFNSVVSRVRDILKFRIQDKKAVINIEGVLPAIKADTTQMEQLLQNIIENALKFSEKSPPVISIKAQKKQGFCEFSIKDNGIGIDPQYSERIFQVFQRLHAKNEYDGTGIGLAICKKIVERHKGRIWVESKGEGKGSTFFFTLPA